MPVQGVSTGDSSPVNLFIYKIYLKRIRISFQNQAKTSKFILKIRLKTIKWVPSAWCQQQIVLLESIALEAELPVEVMVMGDTW